VVAQRVCNKQTTRPPLSLHQSMHVALQMPCYRSPFNAPPPRRSSS
jgi:hypothetical protein